MELNLTFDEVEQLKRISLLDIGVYFKIEISKPAVEYCKKAIEIEHKFQEGLLHEPLKLENCTLYKKLCDAELRRKP